MQNKSKSATCCYCGSHTILTLSEGTRHELKCSDCGAPLSRMKSLRKDHVQDTYTVQGRRDHKPAHASKYGKAPSKTSSYKKKSKRKSFAARFFDVAEDLVEEVFDIFD